MLKKRVEIEQAAFAFEKRRRDRGAVRMEIVPVAIGRVFAGAISCLVGCFSGRGTGSIITLGAVFTVAVAAEAVTPEAVSEEATRPEAMTAEAAVPEAAPEKASFCEAVTALEIPAPRSAMTSVPDFREAIGVHQLEVVANRHRREQRRVDQ